MNENQNPRALGSPSESSLRGPYFRCPGPPEAATVLRVSRRRWWLIVCMRSVYILYCPTHSGPAEPPSLRVRAAQGRGPLPQLTTPNLSSWLELCAPRQAAQSSVFPERGGTAVSPGALASASAPQRKNKTRLGLGTLGKRGSYVCEGHRKQLVCGSVCVCVWSV